MVRSSIRPADPPAGLTRPTRSTLAAIAERIGRSRDVARRVAAWESERFDRRVGIDTGGKRWPSQFARVHGDPASGHIYKREQIRVIRWWLDALPPVDGFTLVDVGSGKGLPLFAAAEARLGFDRLVGVEYVEELHEAAIANVEAYGRRGGTANIALVLGDAATYAWPLEPLVIHFGNPFEEDVMAEVITNLTASYEQLPRPIFAIYHQSWQDISATGNVEMLASARPFARHRLLEPRSFVHRVLLEPYRVDMLESPEAISRFASTPRRRPWRD